MKKVCVMLSAYNGEKYLPRQLDTLAAQTGVDMRLYVRDDGSKDSTSRILREYRDRGVIDKIIEDGKGNLGFADSFYTLVREADPDCDYYAFCDQDDIWLPDKLAEAIKKIRGIGQAKNGVLYCSNLNVTDAQGNLIGMEEDESIRKTNRCTYLYENICTGCTMVFDRAFRDQSLKYYPEGIRLHDHWLFLIAVYTAQWVYDVNSYILYRQHVDNQVGSKKNIDESLPAQFVRFVKRSRTDTTQRLQQLLMGYGGEISEQDKKNIRIVANYKSNFLCRMKFVFFRRFRRRKRDLRFRVRVLFGKV